MLIGSNVLILFQGLEIMSKELNIPRMKRIENKTYFDNLGKKYKGELTDPEPFNITQARPKETLMESARGGVTKKASPRKRKSPRKGPNRTMNKSPEGLTHSKSPGKGMVKTVKINPIQPDTKSSIVEESKMEDRYAKLRIHYSKDQFAEIKVYEHTDPAELANDF